jgi:hypothetical protein
MAGDVYMLRRWVSEDPLNPPNSAHACLWPRKRSGPVAKAAEPAPYAERMRLR